MKYIEIQNIQSVSLSHSQIHSQFTFIPCTQKFLVNNCFSKDVSINTIRTFLGRSIDCSLCRRNILKEDNFAILI